MACYPISGNITSSWYNQSCCLTSLRFLLQCGCGQLPPWCLLTHMTDRKVSYGWGTVMVKTLIFTSWPCRWKGYCRCLRLSIRKHYLVHAITCHRFADLSWDPQVCTKHASCRHRENFLVFTGPRSVNCWQYMLLNVAHDFQPWKSKDLISVSVQNVAKPHLHSPWK